MPVQHLSNRLIVALIGLVALSLFNGFIVTEFLGKYAILWSIPSGFFYGVAISGWVSDGHL